MLDEGADCIHAAVFGASAKRIGKALLDDFPADLREVIEDWRLQTQASDDWSLWLSVTAEEIKTMNTGEWLHAQTVNVLPELVAALEMAQTAVEYYHDHEGCPDTRKAVRDALQNAHKINPPPAPR